MMKQDRAVMSGVGPCKRYSTGRKDLDPDLCKKT